MIYRLLNEEYVDEIVQHAILLNNQSKNRGYADYCYDIYNNSGGVDLVGVIGEYITRDLLGKPQVPNLETFKDPDVENIQVRTSKRHTNRPYFRHKEHTYIVKGKKVTRKPDNPEHQFLFTTVNDTTKLRECLIHGLYSGEEMLEAIAYNTKSVFEINPNNRGPMLVKSRKDLDRDLSKLTGNPLHKPHRVIIAGSREITDYNLLLQAIDFSNFNIIEVVSGTARGADTLGERFASEVDIDVKTFKPNWRKINGIYVGGAERNVQMAEYADALIALYNGTSTGTKHMIKTARNKGMPVVVANTKEGTITKEYCL